ncbi:MAG: hypothetical protein A3J38_02055 [Gammaproteobacteria bacterium RIFCSPHIGHO2_12_FULL_45_9]|nr:MAG: hypothetical protein A3J38_02055 [Gammaproteobacteria bacterium RIFCSPHIGHO2_12_FULL_45_9]
MAQVAKKQWKSALRYALIGIGLISAGVALADGAASTITISTIKTAVDSTVSTVAQILTDISIIAGVGFVLGAFFKFHQHKQNPQQVQLSQGITLLLIGAGLLLFPMLIPTASSALFGSSTTAKVGGSDMTTLIGGTASKS